MKDKGRIVTNPGKEAVGAIVEEVEEWVVAEATLTCLALAKVDRVLSKRDNSQDEATKATGWEITIELRRM